MVLCYMLRSFGLKQCFVTLCVKGILCGGGKLHADQMFITAKMNHCPSRYGDMMESRPTGAWLLSCEHSTRWRAQHPLLLLTVQTVISGDSELTVLGT